MFSITMAVPLPPLEGVARNRLDIRREVSEDAVARMAVSWVLALVRAVRLVGSI